MTWCLEREVIKRLQPQNACASTPDGNLLVGTTSATPQDGDHGFVARATGYTISSVANARVMLLNRAGDDGDILQLRKDNAVVGNIGVDRIATTTISISGGSSGVYMGGVECWYRMRLYLARELLLDG